MQERKMKMKCRDGMTKNNTREDIKVKINIYKALSIPTSFYTTVALQLHYD